MWLTTTNISQLRIGMHLGYLGGDLPAFPSPIQPYSVTMHTRVPHPPAASPEPLHALMRFLRMLFLAAQTF